MADEPRQEQRDRMRTYLDSHRWMDEGPMSFGLTRNERYCLAVIGVYSEETSITETVLSKALNLAPSSVSDAVAKLKVKGYVAGNEPEGNKREKPLRLTNSDGERKFKGLCAFVDGNVRINPLDGNIPI
jgi:DNA-binding MarR family transcriptional regulator